jgi:hypothetical protein
MPCRCDITCPSCGQQADPSNVGTIEGAVRDLVRKYDELRQHHQKVEREHEKLQGAQDQIDAAIKSRNDAKQVAVDLTRENQALNEKLAAGIRSSTEEALSHATLDQLLDAVASKR